MFLTKRCASTIKAAGIFVKAEGQIDKKNLNRFMETLLLKDPPPFNIHFINKEKTKQANKTPKVLKVLSGDSLLTNKLICRHIISINLINNKQK